MTKPKSTNIDPQAQISILEIRSAIESIEKNSILFEETNFDDRLEAIDFIEFHVIDRIEGLLQIILGSEELIFLNQRAETVKGQLEEINLNLFKRLRENIRISGCSGMAFKLLIDKYTKLELRECINEEETGYDNFDMFINDLCFLKAMPEETKCREQEMVYYQKTPARIIFELATQHQFKKEDVFFDIGSGLGQPAILLNLITGIQAFGIEFEPAFCDYARESADALNLSNVTFINKDARKADYSDGTIFFMYTPFRGKILEDVLDILRKESQKRRITIFTYGPCSAEIAPHNWLNCVAGDAKQVNKLCFFRSR
jgi:hypothetical protein